MAMNYFVRRAWDVPQRRHTPIEVYRNRGLFRREFLQTLGLGAAGVGFGGLMIGCSRPSDSEIAEAGAVPPLPVSSASVYPAEPNPAFEYGRPETPARDAAEYTNFYEFSRTKNSWQHVGRFQPQPWAIEIDGLCSRPGTFDIDDLHQQMPFEE
jgi:methionine sulfoxide reductase catalytic subunit